MALFFALAFFFPEKTGFWIINNGLPTLLLEFFGLFVVIISGALAIQTTRGEERYNAHWLAYLLMFILLLVSTFGLFMSSPIGLLNPPLVLFFLVSTTVKFIDIRLENKLGAEHKLLVTTAAAYLLAFFCALLAGTFLAPLFPDLLSSYKAQYYINANIYSPLSSPIVSAAWGILYYSAMALAPLILFEKAATKSIQLHLDEKSLEKILDNRP